ncbi:ATP-binding protein [bacterium]|nr:ATP-binding protein [bacterium]
MITSYQFSGITEPWSFKKVNLGRINLLVGASGCGKTRFLNTLFNLSTFIAQGQSFRQGKWDITARIEEKHYEWHYEGVSDSEGVNKVTVESLKLRTDSSEEMIVERTLDEFKFKSQQLPKLEREKLSITMLKEEDTIQPFYRMFAHGLRRLFHASALQDAVAFQSIPDEIIKKFESKPDLEEFVRHDFSVQTKLYLLQKFFPEKYELATSLFQDVFPSIKQTRVDLVSQTPSPIKIKGSFPVFAVKEKGVQNWLPLPELSSGMQKVLLIITDVLSFTSGCIYMIDEYENSLGVNAIDFLPDFLIDHGGSNQFFITTHHPYLINNMPMSSWLVLNRRGSNVAIRNGSEFKELFGKSKQKAFIQLINDSFYKGE